MASGNSVDDFTGVNSIDIGEGRQLNLYKAKNAAINITRQDGTVVTLKNFQDGDMASTSKTNNKVDSMSDAQASPAASVSYDSLGTGTVTLQQGSASNDLLSDLYNQDEVFGFHLAYGDEISGGDHCMIQKSPDAPFGKTVPTRAWTIVIYDYKYDGNRNA